MSNPRILLTGGTGLLGRRFIQNYDSEYDITVLTKDRKYDKIGKEQHIECDLSKYWTFKDLPKNFDILIMLAQERNYKDFPANSNNIFMVNVYSVHNLLEFARRTNIKKVIYTSTGGVYKDQMQALTENSPIRNTSDLSFYFTTKISGENLVASYRNFFETSIVRPFFIYGEKQNSNNLIFNLKNRILNNEAITLNGSNGININPIYVKDAADAIKTLIEVHNDFVINLAGTEIINIRELSDRIGDLIGRTPQFVIEEKKNDLVADISRLKVIMPTQPWTSLRDGIAKCILTR